MTRSVDQPFIYRRSFSGGTVELNLLSGEYWGTGAKHRTQRVQDVRARKARGCELALELNEPVTISGLLPDGAEDSTVIRVATIVPFIVMKGMALFDRLKEKDAWDIYFCLTNYPGGVEAIIELFQPHISRGLVHEVFELPYMIQKLT